SVQKHPRNIRHVPQRPAHRLPHRTIARLARIVRMFHVTHDLAISYGPQNGRNLFKLYARASAGTTHTKTGVRYTTSTMLSNSPNGFGSECTLCGSACQRPSTTSRYRYRPGFNATSALNVSSLSSRPPVFTSLTIRSGCQLLKS